MGWFDFLGSKPEKIWTLDAYIDQILKTSSSSPEAGGNLPKYLRGLGEKICETYGAVGIDHAWRAALSRPGTDELRAVLKREWEGLDGWSPR